MPFAYLYCLLRTHFGSHIIFTLWFYNSHQDLFVFFLVLLKLSHLKETMFQVHYQMVSSYFSNKNTLLGLDAQEKCHPVNLAMPPELERAIESIIFEGAHSESCSLFCLVLAPYPCLYPQTILVSGMVYWQGCLQLQIVVYLRRSGVNRELAFPHKMSHLKVDDRWGQFRRLVMMTFAPCFLPQTCI